jgi:signal transduction histidine kinase
VPGVSSQAAGLLATSMVGAAVNDQPLVLDAAWYAVPLALVGGAAYTARRGPVRELAPPDRRTVHRFALVGTAGMTLLAGWQFLLLELGGGTVPDPMFNLVGAGGLGLLAGTAFGTLYARQRRAARQSERERERLDEFASVLSHDLRTPLGVARGRLELARTTGEQDHLEEAERALERMEELVEGTLALARSGSTALSPEEVGVDSEARQCWDLAETGDADLAVESDTTVVADVDRLQQALQNLFENAVEHGDASVVRVGPLEDGGFFVADDGTGIPADHRETVFERGFSTDDGPGLGLAIVATVAEEHGWTVAATESTEGGARFDFSPDA